MYWNKFLVILFLSLAFKASGQVSFSGKQSEEWMAVQNQLITAKGKVENQQKTVEALILQKENLKGAQLSEKIESLKQAHIELLRVINNYNTINSNFETKYPEKGAAIGRIYKRIDPTNIEMIESKMTLEGRLHRLNSKILKQYPKSATLKADTDETNDKLKKIKKKNTLPDSKPNELQVTDQIILQK